MLLSDYRVMHANRHRVKWLRLCSQISVRLSLLSCLRRRNSKQVHYYENSCQGIDGKSNLFLCEHLLIHEVLMSKWVALINIVRNRAHMLVWLSICFSRSHTNRFYCRDGFAVLMGYRQLCNPREVTVIVRTAHIISPDIYFTRQLFFCPGNI